MQDAKEVAIELRHMDQVSALTSSQEETRQQEESNEEPVDLDDDPSRYHKREDRHEDSSDDVSSTVHAELVLPPNNPTLVTAVAFGDDPEIAQLRQQAAKAEKADNTKKWKLMVALLAAVLVAVGGVTAYFLLRERQATSSPNPFDNCLGYTIETKLITSIATNTIPTCLGRLTQLMYIGLESEELQGTIPTELGLLTKLIELWLYRNSLEGTIPTELGELTELSSLQLYENQLTGTIPTEMGFLTSLIYLDFNTNNITGPVPPSGES